MVLDRLADEEGSKHGATSLKVEVGGEREEEKCPRLAERRRTRHDDNSMVHERATTNLIGCDRPTGGRCDCATLDV